MKTFLTFAILLLVGSAARAVTIEDALEATCKISSPTGTGTGCCFEVRDNEVRILTNFHVAEGRQDLRVEFWHNGFRSLALPAASRWWSYVPVEVAERDMAVVAIPLSMFGDTPPPIIPLAARGTLLYQGQTIYSAGCDDAQYPKLWKGHITIPSSREAVQFEPTSIPGQSGSALFAKNAEGSLEIVGLIAWKDPNDRFGVAMTLATLYESMDGAASRTSTSLPLVDVPRRRSLVQVKEKFDASKPIFAKEKAAVERYKKTSAKIMDKTNATHCIHGVPLGTRCVDCEALSTQCPGGACPATPYRRGFGWQFGWGGERSAPVPPQQPYQQPYQAPPNPYGNPYQQNPGYSPYPTTPDPRSVAPGSAAATKADLEQFTTAVDDKLEETRKEILERQEAIRVEHDKRLSGLESLADQVKDIPAVRSAADAALQQIAATQESLKKVDERIDAETENVVKATDAKLDDVQEQVATTQKTLLQRLAEKASQSDVLSKFEEAKSTGLSVKDAALSVVEQRLANIGPAEGWTMGKTLAAAVGVSGPIGLGLAGLGFFLAKKRPITKFIQAHQAVPAGSTTIVHP